MDASRKTKFSEVLDRARSRGPQPLRVTAKLTAVIVSAEEMGAQHSRVGNLAEFFAPSPLRDSPLQLDGRRPKIALGIPLSTSPLPVRAQSHDPLLAVAAPAVSVPVLP